MFACLLPKKTACDTSSRYPTALAGKVSQLAVSVCPSVCYHSIFWINNPWLCFFARSWVTTIAGRGLKVKVQWRRQLSKGARSFRSQTILRVPDAAKGSPDPVAWRIGGGRERPASLPFPSPFRSPSFPFFASSNPLASLRSRTPKIQVGGLGSAVSSPNGPVGLWCIKL